MACLELRDSTCFVATGYRYVTTTRLPMNFRSDKSVRTSEVHEYTLLNDNDNDNIDVL
jgi:hypothetical protein